MDTVNASVLIDNVEADLTSHIASKKANDVVYMVRRFFVDKKQSNELLNEDQQAGSSYG